MKKYVTEVIHRMCGGEVAKLANDLVTALVDGHLAILDRPWRRIAPHRDEWACPYCSSDTTQPHDMACAFRVSCAALGLELASPWEWRHEEAHRQDAPDVSRMRE